MVFIFENECERVRVRAGYSYGGCMHAVYLSGNRVGACDGAFGDIVGAKNVLFMSRGLRLYSALTIPPEIPSVIAPQISHITKTKPQNTRQT